jgi:hypothetical protein
MLSLVPVVVVVVVNDDDDDNNNNNMNQRCEAKFKYLGITVTYQNYVPEKKVTQN